MYWFTKSFFFFFGGTKIGTQLFFLGTKKKQVFFISKETRIQTKFILHKTIEEQVEFF